MKRRAVPRNRRGRKGLSTLEFVLALPMLLFVMALMINFGTVASWKVRALAVARHQLWSHRAHRAGGLYPRPDYWPATATQGVGGPGPVPALDDPRVDLPIVRGPSVGDFLVDRDLFDPTQGMRNGHAEMQRRFPLLNRLGGYTLHAGTEALDDRWQFERFPRLPQTRDRRIPVLYTLPRTSAELGLAMQYVEAAVRVYYFRLQRYLWPLDYDQEFIFWGRWFISRGVPHWSDHPPDFYREWTWLQAFCHLDEQAVRQYVDRLIDHIQGNSDPQRGPVVDSIAQHMTERFIGFYERVIRELENLMSADPPPPPDDVAWMQQQIDALRQKIALLRQPLGNP